MRLQNQILIIRVSLYVFILSLLGPLCTEAAVKTGSEFQVNSGATFWNQGSPSVAGLSGGGFVVTWQSYMADLSDYGINGQLFDNAGNEVGREFWVNTYTNSNQSAPSVAGLSGGGFVVTWQSYQNGSDYDIYGQLFEISLEIKGKAMPWIPLLLLDD